MTEENESEGISKFTALGIGAVSLGLVVSAAGFMPWSNSNWLIKIGGFLLTWIILFFIMVTAFKRL